MVGHFKHKGQHYEIESLNLLCRWTEEDVKWIVSMEIAGLGVAEVEYTNGESTLAKIIFKELKENLGYGVVISLIDIEKMSGYKKIVLNEKS